MTVVHMTEAEVVRNIATVLEQVHQGSEIVVEQDNKPPKAGRPISAIIAALHARHSEASMDDDFAADVAEGIATHREPWNPPSWEYVSLTSPPLSTR